jgi:transposase
MIPVPSGVRVWLAVGRTDMRKGMNGLALQVQQALGRDPHAGDLYVFRGARGDLIKIIWHDGIGMSLYSKRLESGWRTAGLSGRRRPTGWWRFRRRSLHICSTGSIGGTRAIRSGRSAPDNQTALFLQASRRDL